MRKARGLTAEEAALWRKVKASVTPLRPEKAADPAPDPLFVPQASSAPNPQKSPARSHTHPPGPHPYKSPPKPAPPADRSPEKRVRRGKIEVAAALDLHGYTQDQACRALHAFLQAQQRRDACVVLVVTGKGGRLIAGEATAGVLRQRFPDWLQHPAVRGLVAGYAPAHARHGGGGAFYVFLKRWAE
jgi:DNA-nicking Smr family endonuclease